MKSNLILVLFCAGLFSGCAVTRQDCLEAQPAIDRAAEDEIIKAWDEETVR